MKGERIRIDLPFCMDSKRSRIQWRLTVDFLVGWWSHRPCQINSISKTGKLIDSSLNQSETCKLGLFMCMWTMWCDHSIPLLKRTSDKDLTLSQTLLQWPDNSIRKNLLSWKKQRTIHFLKLSWTYIWRLKSRYCTDWSSSVTILGKRGGWLKLPH